MDFEHLKAWQAFAASLIGAALVLLGRVSGTWKTFKKDGAEGSLFSQLSTALEASEKRRVEEADGYRRREEAHERRHAENMDRLIDLTKQVAEMKGALAVMERQYAEVTAHLQRSEVINKELTRELGEYRQLVLSRIADLIPSAPHEPGKPAVITGS
ncbi:hypothetical protein [Pulveribacter sp.]|uniref:hypothetical protein n=1 Tax=Pulveribacter sp. TaxID=2678893 RepID=UPI0028AE6A2B|nr:hypothetical protein [Pulveribacter sp.]